jgi:hypothetical protein
LTSLFEALRKLFGAARSLFQRHLDSQHGGVAAFVDAVAKL